VDRQYRLSAIWRPDRNETLSARAWRNSAAREFSELWTLTRGAHCGGHAKGHVVSVSAIVLYEWLRGPRTDAERDAVDAFFEADLMAVFGRREAARAADLYGRVKAARQRQADLAIAACAIEVGASLWTLGRSDFEDIPGLTLVPE
jgi:predicted nucleic acid-binding protein